MEAFAARGLEGARVDDIAQRAGINKQLVYHYFGSKDGLYTAVLEEIYHEIRERSRHSQLRSSPGRGGDAPTGRVLVRLPGATSPNFVSHTCRRERP